MNEEAESERDDGGETSSSQQSSSSRYQKGVREVPPSFGDNYDSCPGVHRSSRFYKLIGTEILQGVTFAFDKIKKGNPNEPKTFYMRCSDRNCKGRALIRENVLLIDNKPHSCLLVESTEEKLIQIEVNRAMDEMKTRAREDSSAFKIIYNEVMMNYSLKVRERVLFNNAKKCMEQARRCERPTTPPTMEQLISGFENGCYPSKYQDLYQGSVSVKIRGRMQYAILLGDSGLFQHVNQGSTFYHIDATFGVLPGYLEVLKVRSSQVLHIVADYKGGVVCVMTVIMSCRKVGLYRAVYSSIREKFPCFKPRMLMADWETALRKTAAAIWPDARMLGCWFHYAKALFAKLKGKFRLGCVFFKRASSVHKKLAHIFRQYFALPLLRPHHIHPQISRLEAELKSLCGQLTADEARRVNLFHNYVVDYWCIHIGVNSFSVFGSPHTTNNRIERFNKELSMAVRKHPQFFHFLDKVIVHVVQAGFTVVAQVDAGTYVSKESMSLAEQSLVENSSNIRQDYAQHKISAENFLGHAACHFDEKAVRKDFAQAVEVRPGENDDVADEGASDILNEEAAEDEAQVDEPARLDGDEDDPLPDFEGPEESDNDGQANTQSSSAPSVPESTDWAEVNERNLELELDPDLQEFQPNDGYQWVTTQWIPAPSSQNLLPRNQVLPTEEISNVVALRCGICDDEISHAVTLKCSHMMCVNCSENRLVKRCPFCQSVKVVLAVSNLRNLDVSRKATSSDEIVPHTREAPADQQVASNSRFIETRNSELINELLREEGVDDPETYRRRMRAESRPHRERGNFFVPEASISTPQDASPGNEDAAATLQEEQQGPGPDSVDDDPPSPPSPTPSAIRRLARKAAMRRLRGEAGIDSSTDEDTDPSQHGLSAQVSRTSQQPVVGVDGVGGSGTLPVVDSIAMSTSDIEDDEIFTQESSQHSNPDGVTRSSRLDRRERAARAIALRRQRFGMVPPKGRRFDED